MKKDHNKGYDQVIDISEVKPIPGTVTDR